MKTPITKRLILGGLAIAIGTLFTSCVDPYYAQGGQTHVTASYNAGYEVRTLPPGYRTEVIEGTRYYNYNGTYYRPHSGRYVVVEAPRHYSRPSGHREVVIRELPRGYRVVERDGARYYQVRDVYYQQRGSGYVVVTRPY
ncbi:MAG: DUF6515 family protein [Luteolibacter sp.]